MYTLSQRTATLQREPTALVLPFKGERYSLIYFSSSGHDRMAPKDVQQCEALGFCRLPTAPLSHVYRPAEFATPHKEFEYTFGYHVLLRRPSYRVGASMAWRWTSMALTRRWREETHTHTDKDTKNKHRSRRRNAAPTPSRRLNGVARGLGAARDARKLVKRERSPARRSAPTRSAPA